MKIRLINLRVILDRVKIIDPNFVKIAEVILIKKLIYGKIDHLIVGKLEKR